MIFRQTSGVNLLCEIKSAFAKLINEMVLNLVEIDDKILLLLAAIVEELSDCF